MAWLLHFLAGFSFPIIANNSQTAPRAAFGAPTFHLRTIAALGQSLADLLFGSRSWRCSGPADFLVRDDEPQSAPSPWKPGDAPLPALPTVMTHTLAAAAVGSACAVAGPPPCWEIPRLVCS
jgi:hypothetical protein